MIKIRKGPSGKISKPGLCQLLSFCARLKIGNALIRFCRLLIEYVDGRFTQCSLDLPTDPINGLTLPFSVHLSTVLPNLDKLFAQSQSAFNFGEHWFQPGEEHAIGTIALFATK
jgi:hypothetical protein